MSSKRDKEKAPLTKETPFSNHTISEQDNDLQGYKHFQAVGTALKQKNHTHRKSGVAKTSKVITERDVRSNLTSNYKEYTLEDRLIPTKSAAQLRAESPKPPTFLPVLGHSNIIAEGWVTLLAGYPKAGKTELAVKLACDWSNQHTILFISEEPESIWSTRLQAKRGNLENIAISQALGASPGKIRSLIQTTTADIVIVDTVRNLFGLENENDNSEVARVLKPFITAARDGDKTLILLHHTRKGGGERGEGITGGHAFLGIVDAGLEVIHQGGSERRRIIRGSARIYVVPRLLYEMTDKGDLIALGKAEDFELENVRERIAMKISTAWKTTTEVIDLIDPHSTGAPSREQVRKALDKLAHEKIIERDPSIQKGEQRGKTYRWRLTPQKGGGAEG